MGYWPVVKKVLKDSTVVVVVGDARLPQLSLNKELKRRIRQYGKKSVLVFNKIDLLSNRALKNLKKNFKSALFVSGVKNIGISKLKTELMIIGKKEKVEEIYVGVVGYPNIGKSSIINALAKRARAKTSKKAGTTRGIQWIRAGSLRVLDSPGVVPFDDNEVKLGLLGAKNPEKMRNPEKVALAIISELRGVNEESLEEYYGTKFGEEEVLITIGKVKGFLLKGGIVDERRTALFVIKDWFKGKLRV
jgi:ribosome biogenesis GTPase A